MNKEFFKKNREKLIEKIEDNSVIVLFAGNAPKKVGMKIIHLLQIEIFIILQELMKKDQYLFFQK